MDTKERYWRNMLVLFIVFFGIVLFWQFRPFVAGFLGAFTIYMLVRKQLFFLTEKKKINKSATASLILLEVVLCILVPTFLIFWLLFSEAKSIDLNPQDWIASMQGVVDTIQQKIGYNLLNSDNIHAVTAFIPKVAQAVLGEISSFAINAVVLLFVLYFMLINARKMEAYIADILPFKQVNKKIILDEVHQMTISNAIGVPALAVVQGVVASIGYWIFGIEEPFVWGVLTGVCGLLPVIGTAAIWIPLSINFFITGEIWSGLFLLLYGSVVIVGMDNVIRMFFMKEYADVHPLVTIFGVILGINLFGFWGIIFGPLVLSGFWVLLKIYKNEFLEN